MRRLVFLLLSVPLLMGGCVSAIKLRNPATGAVAQCGPYSALWYLGPTGWDPRDSSVKPDDRDARCVAEYEKLGYVRVERKGKEGP